MGHRYGVSIDMNDMNEEELQIPHSTPSGWLQPA
jgi:hypothetical protein